MSKRCFILLVIVAFGCAARNSYSPAGTWSGELKFPAATVHVRLDLKVSGDATWEGVLLGVGENNAPGDALQNVISAGNVVSFSMPASLGFLPFRGTITSDGKEIAGELIRPNAHIPARFKKLPAEPAVSTTTYRYDDDEIAQATAEVSQPLGNRTFPAPLDHPAISYVTRPTNDVVAKLNKQIEKGTVELKYEGEQGYLRSILTALSVPIESQMAVFSKTSVQAGRISPTSPRTLFFNDNVTVGWARGGFVELAALDPEQGAVFYTAPPIPLPKPSLAKNNSCLTCHDSNEALGIPGMLLRSVFTGQDGVAWYQLGRFTPDHRSPFQERWGGWYVTGKAATLQSMGNTTVRDVESPDSFNTSVTQIAESLAGKFDTGPYVTPYSDIVALMVFEHQMHMANLLTRIGWETRLALDREKNVKTDASKLITTELLKHSADEFVDYLLFVDEAPLPTAIAGTSGFAETFSTQGPFDNIGRSLRQFDLKTRLMRYPCSYMIYSAAFDALPTQARDAIYQRAWTILSGQQRDGKYARLSFEDRKAVVDILRETKAGLPNYFQPFSIIR